MGESDNRTLRGCQELVARFHEKCLPPGVTPKDQFMKLVEEVGELAVGLHKGSRVLTADALADCLYVLCGIANRGGYDLAVLFDEVHASNMTKTMDGGLSPKGPGYVAPKLSTDYPPGHPLHDHTDCCK